MTPFKVIQGHRFGTNRNPCDFLLVINTNLHPISYRFGVIADYCSNFRRKTATLRFGALFRGLGATFAVHLRLIGKPIANFVFVLIELVFARYYGRGGTREYRLEINVFEGGGSASAKILGKRVHSPLTIFARIGRIMPYNYVADNIHIKKLCNTGRRSSIKVQLWTENGYFAL